MGKRNVLTIMLLLIFILPSPGIMLAQQDSEFVLTLIIDKTASMKGVGDGNGIDIWDDVQKYLLDFVEHLRLETKVLIFEFDAGLYGPEEFRLIIDNDKNAIKEYIRNINPNGLNTAIYNAMDGALDYLNRNYPNQNQLIYLITDGRDNYSSIRFSQVLGNFSASKGEYDHMYYIDLRDRAPDSVRIIIEQNPDISISKGFTKTITLAPMFETIPFILGRSGTIEQRFTVYGEELPSNFSFGISIDYPSNDANIDISPSVNIQPREIEKGKYSCNFNLELLAGNINESIIINIHLRGSSVENYIINFQPSFFKVNLRLPEQPKVVLPQGGWQ